MVNATPPFRFTPWEIDPILIVFEVRWAAGPVWTGVENFVSTGIRSPDCQTLSESLYRLSYCGLIRGMYLNNMRPQLCVTEDMLCNVTASLVLAGEYQKIL